MLPLPIVTGFGRLPLEDLQPVAATNRPAVAVQICMRNSRRCHGDHSTLVGRRIVQVTSGAARITRGDMTMFAGSLEDEVIDLVTTPRVFGHFWNRWFHERFKGPVLFVHGARINPKPYQLDLMFI